MILDNGADYVVKAIQKRDPSPFVTDVYTNSIPLLFTSRGMSENIKNYESRFEAQLSRFKSHGAGSIPDSLLALKLLANAEIGDN